MFCPKCGRQHADNAKFCPGCGNVNPKAATKSAAPPLPANPPPLPQDPAPVPARTESKRASPPPVPANPQPTEEEELVLPPPDSGMTISFRANQQGRVERLADPSRDGVRTVPGSAEGASVSSALAGAAEDCVLPEASPAWTFRTQTSALADKITAGLSASGATNPMSEAITRFVRGALMHTDVYRTAASRGSLMTEALWLSILLIVISVIGLRFGNLFGYSSSFTFKLIIIRALAWAGSVFAVHWVAKTQQKVNLPPAAWFRAMAYAQAGLILTLVPALGVLSTAWVAVCTVAALQDVCGKDTTAGIILLVVAGVASAIVATVVGSVWN